MTEKIKLCKECGLNKPCSEFFSWTNNRNKIYLTTLCKNCHREKNKQWFIENKLKAKNIRDRYYERLRSDIFEHYGNRCNCCGFDSLNKIVNGRRFLQLHHVNGGGAVDYRRFGNRRLLSMIRRNNYPNIYSILCAACNVSMEPRERTCEYHKWKKDF